MKQLVRVLIAGICFATASGHAVCAARPSQKIMVRLDTGRIPDASLRQQAKSALQDIAGTLTTLSNIMLTEEEIAKEIGWISTEPLQLPPLAACQVMIGAKGDHGRSVLRTVYVFDKGSGWRQDASGTLSVGVTYFDPVLPENVVHERQTYRFRDAHWRLSRQERFSNVLSHRSPSCLPNTGGTAGE